MKKIRQWIAAEHHWLPAQIDTLTWSEIFDEIYVQRPEPTPERILYEDHEIWHVHYGHQGKSWSWIEAKWQRERGLQTVTCNWAKGTS